MHTYKYYSFGYFKIWFDVMHSMFFSYVFLFQTIILNHISAKFHDLFHLVCYAFKTTTRHGVKILKTLFYDAENLI